MIRIENITDLRRAWSRLIQLLTHDLVDASSLSNDPVGTLRRYGYDLSPNAELAFRAALP